MQGTFRSRRLRSAAANGGISMASETHPARSMACQNRHGFSSESELVTVRFWMNGCAQMAHVHPAGLQRYRRDLLAKGAVLLN